MAAVALITGCASAQSDSVPLRNGCAPVATWLDLRGNAPSQRTQREVLAAAATRSVVLLGEHHDDPDHHRWQLHTIAALHTLNPDMVIGFEMFPRRVQGALDRWVAGELDEKAFLAQADWSAVWNLPPELYMPLFHFARLHRIPMLALNVERSLIRKIGEKGWAATEQSEREGVSMPAPASAGYRESLRDVFATHFARRKSESAGDKHAGNAGAAPDAEAAFNRFVEAQTTWDRAMAEVLATRARAGAQATRPLVVGVMGSGHIRNGHGVPHQLRDLGVASVGTLIPVAADTGCADLPRDYADAVFMIDQTRSPERGKPRLGVVLMQDGDAIRIEAVVPDSLAKSSGLLARDRITHVAGRRAPRIADVTDAIRAQPAGTWLPITVEREGRSEEIVIRFPVEP